MSDEEGAGADVDDGGVDHAESDRAQADSGQPQSDQTHSDQAHSDQAHGEDSAVDGEVSVTSRVRVFPGTDDEACGVVADDFGEGVGIPVEIGGDRIAGPARRWAVQLDDARLVFVDSHQLVAE